MVRERSGNREGGCFTFSCGCFTGGCLSALFVLSLSILLFAYGYWVGVINHPGGYAYVRVAGEEMRPAIREGSVVLVDRAYFERGDSRVERGDIVLIEPTEKMDRTGRVLLRVAALAGEAIAFDASGALQIGGKPMENYERLAGFVYQATGAFSSPYQLGSDELLLIGDNPAFARDVRAGGVIPMKNLRGKAISILFPPNRIGRLD